MAKFAWKKWDFDGEGEAYIIKKSLCPSHEDVLDLLIYTDNLRAEHRQEVIDDGIQDGWCKYQVRSDWEDGEPRGGYVVETNKAYSLDIHGKRKRGWFPVWIVRAGEWI